MIGGERPRHADSIPGFAVEIKQRQQVTEGRTMCPLGIVRWLQLALLEAAVIPVLLAINQGA